MTEVNTEGAVGLVCRVLSDNALSETHVREAAQSAAEHVPDGRCVAFIWNTPHDWGSERPVEAWLNNALLRSQSPKNFIFFGNVAVRAYRDLAAAPTRTLVVMMFRRLGDKAYLRKRTASADLLEESYLDTKAYSFTRDWANNVWHFHEKNVEWSVISRLSSVCRWNDEKTLTIGVQDVLEPLPGDLIPIATKQPYSWRPPMRAARSPDLFDLMGATG